MKKRRQWTTYSGSGKRVAPRTRTSRVSRGKEMGVPRLWVQLIVCGALFVALIGLKLLMPGNLSALRGTLGQCISMCRRAAARSLFLPHWHCF